MRIPPDRKVRSVLPGLDSLATPTEAILDLPEAVTALSIDAAKSSEREQEAAASRVRPAFQVVDRRFTNLDAEEIERADAGRVEQPPSFVEQLEQRLRDRESEVETLRERMSQQLALEVAEVQRRLAREAEQEVRNAKVALAEPMVEVFEALQRSLAASRDSGIGIEALREGIERVAALMERKLAAIGLERVLALGEPFDPNQHEAVMMQPVDDVELDGRVTAEFSPGFSMDGRVVRPPKVQVGRAS